MSRSRLAEIRVKSVIPDNDTGKTDSCLNDSRNLSRFRINSSPNLSPVESLLASLQNPSQVEAINHTNILETHKIISDHYNNLTYNILKSFYPKFCKNHPDIHLEPSKVKGRQLMGKCPICHSQRSLAKNTPLQGLHLPLSYFSYILHEIILSYPNVITSKAIQRRLNLKSYPSAWLLKKRIQAFMSQLNDSFLRQTKEALELEAKQNNNEKMPFRGDVSKAIKQRVIVNIDSLAIFSVGVSANKYRSRYRHGGITSSIYRSVKSGGEQVGSLASNITIKGCLSFYESHPLTTSDYAISHLSKVLSPYNVLMADEAYSSLFGKYRNVRLINHSLKAKRKIHTFSRERWSKEGVNSNAVEGANGVLKTAMRQYRWFNCKYSQLYLNEFAVAKNLKFFKMEKNIIFGVNSERDFCGNRIGEGRSCPVLLKY
ncbi:hypothetical protein [Leptospira soteropolitanensis]|nr:hypothetical protein [Leptospira soteropolitanensis]MCW7522234.1 transposase [Leptospira soteropolitanensis]